MIGLVEVDILELFLIYIQQIYIYRSIYIERGMYIYIYKCYLKYKQIRGVLNFFFVVGEKEGYYIEENYM